MIRKTEIRAHLIRFVIALCLLGSFFYLDRKLSDLRKKTNKPVQLVFKPEYLRSTPQGKTLSTPITIERIILAGPFNQWNRNDHTSAMTKKNNKWIISRIFPPGETPYKFVVYCKNIKKPIWVHNPDASRQRDDGFGGLNSILTIESYEGTSILLLLLLIGSASILLLYSLCALLYHWFFSSRLSQTVRILLIFLFVFLLTNTVIFWFNLRLQRKIIKGSVTESMALVHAGLQGMGINFLKLSDKSQLKPVKLKSAFKKLFYHARTRTGDSLYSRLGTSIHRIILFDSKFNLIHIADRKELPAAAMLATNPQRIHNYYRTRVFGDLIKKQKNNPGGPRILYSIFGNPDKREVSSSFYTDSKLLGFNIALIPIVEQNRITAHYGVVIFPRVFAAHIKDALLINIGWSVFLLLFYVLFFIFRPRMRALSPETLADFATRYTITKREQEIITLLVRGTDYRTIADTLFISLKTVKAHVYNIYQKAGVKNRLELLDRIRKTG